MIVEYNKKEKKTVRFADLSNGDVFRSESPSSILWLKINGNTVFDLEDNSTATALPDWKVIKYDAKIVVGDK